MPRILDGSFNTKNFLLNGGMDLFDYATGTVTLDTAFTYQNANKWRVRYDALGAGLVSAVQARRTAQSPDAKTSFAYEFDIRRNAGGQGSILLMQRIESILSAELLESLSLSFYIRCPVGGTVTLQLSSATAVNNFSSTSNTVSYSQSVSGSTSFQMLKFENLSRPVNYTNGMQIMIQFTTDVASVQDASTVFYWFAQFMLNNGRTSLPFERAGTNIQQDMLMTQRYSRKLIGSVGIAGSSTQVDFAIEFSPPMRVGPTLRQNGILQVTDAISTDFNQSAVGSTAIINASDVGGRFRFGNFSGLTIGRVYFSEADGSGAIVFDADL